MADLLLALQARGNATSSVTANEAEIAQLLATLRALPTRTVVFTEDTIPPTTMRRQVIIDQATAKSIRESITAKQQQNPSLLAVLQVASSNVNSNIGSFNSALEAISSGSSVNLGSIVWQALGIAALLALFPLLAFNGMRSMPYGLLFLSVASFAIFTSSGTLSFAVSNLLLSVFPILLFVMISVVVRLLILAIAQNRDLAFDEREIWRLIGLTLSRWWVIAVFAVLGFWASSTIDSFAERLVYCIGQEQAACEPEAGTVIRDWPEHSDIQGDIDLSIDKHFLDAEARIDEGLAQALAGTDGSGEAVKSAVLAFVFDSEDAVLPQHLYTTYVPSLRPPPSCRWFFPDIGCFAERYIKKAINAAYENARARQRVRLSIRLSDLGAQGESETDAVLRLVSRELHTSLNDARFAIKATVSNIFLAINMLNLFASFLLSVALIKSFVFIFARFYFKDQPERYIPMESGDASEELPPSNIKDTFASNYVFNANTSDHYVNRKYDVSGVPGNISVPIPMQGAGRRILSRTWILNHVGLSRFPDALIQTGQAAQFVEWELYDGEKIYIDPSNLVSFSRGIKIKTELSLRVTSIMFGRLFFFTLAGPGTVVLRTIGKPKICPAKENGSSFAPGRFVAWAANSRLGIVAETNLTNIYFSGSQIALRDQQDAAVIDAKKDDARSIGALRFIPACVLPF